MQNGEVLAARAHQRRTDAVTLEQYQSFEKTADITIFAPFARVTQRRERCESDLLGGTVLGALQSQPFAQPGPGIVTGQAIDLHDVFPAILGKRRHRFGNGCFLSDQPNGIARRDARQRHVGRIDPGKAATDVLGQSFGRLSHQIAGDRVIHCFVLRHHRLAASCRPLNYRLSLSCIAISGKSPRSSRKERSSSCRPK